MDAYAYVCVCLRMSAYVCVCLRTSAYVCVHLRACLPASVCMRVPLDSVCTYMYDEKRDTCNPIFTQ